MIRLYNTLTRKVEEFLPLHDFNIGMYTCGPTVYRDVHIGNFRSYLTADILRRVLTYNGFNVRQIKNITDVGHMRTVGHGHHQEQIDPVIREALKAEKTPQQIAEYYTELFWQDEKKLNILPPERYTKATEHIEEMIAMIKTLVSKGFAYETGGTVYFDVKKFKNYGRLSGNTLDKMDKLLRAVRISVETDKKDSADFALWKKAEEGRAASWNSPWGRGFPCLHIECSAMSMKYLGETLDIHTGGEDNVFPHHEDEIAQSEGVSGKQFVRYWVHTKFLLIDGQKMARSKGNVYTISDLEERGFTALDFRFLTLMTHYRAKMNFTWEALSGAQTALNRLREEVEGWSEPKIGCAEFEQKFQEAINDDLNMPEALAVMWKLVKSDYPTSAKAESLFKFDQVLGLDLKRKLETTLRQSSGQGNKKLEVPVEVVRLVQEREELRRQKRFHLADQLRNKIKKMGYQIEDDDENGKTRVDKI
ncbi:cysteine--tRNA ligase [Candidatus Microgenomates bacterium]|nr:cysteine--tRNA ligase [Candidatus Microgenomates bacterium]